MRQVHGKRRLMGKWAKIISQCFQGVEGCE